MHARRAQTVVWDIHEHYEKMSRRSRYRVATAQGAVQLSVPLLGGRDQRAAMQDIRIDNSQPWARTHWRTIRTAYRRAPFFEHFEDSLERLFAERFDRIADFNRASVGWLRSALRIEFSEAESAAYVRTPDGAADLRDERLRSLEDTMQFIPYTQVFGERHGFLANLSVLDALFSEGPGALRTA